MKLRNRILEIFIVCFLLPTSGFTQAPPFVVAYPASTPMASGTPGIPLSAAVDKYGNQQVVVVAPGGTGASPVKAEDSVATTGDPGVVALGVVNEGSTAKAADGDYTSPALTATGAVLVNIDNSYQRSQGAGILKLEDAAATSGDALVGVAGEINTGLTTKAANGDYGTIALGAAGAVLSVPVYDGNYTVTQTPLITEDFALTTTGGVGIKTFLQAQDPLTADVGSSGDAALPKGDLAGRTITTAAPSGEMLQGCNTEITTATTGTIINATPSKFNFMTGFTCTNTGGAATRVVIEDGDGVDMATLNLAATTGYATATFPAPGIRTNVVNKTIRANVITTGSATICCVSGYTGVI